MKTNERTNDVHAEEIVSSHCSCVDYSRHIGDALAVLVDIGDVSHWNVESAIVQLVVVDLDRTTVGFQWWPFALSLANFIDSLDHLRRSARSFLVHSSAATSLRDDVLRQSDLLVIRHARHAFVFIDDRLSRLANDLQLFESRSNLLFVLHRRCRSALSSVHFDQSDPPAARSTPTTTFDRTNRKTSSRLRRVGRCLIASADDFYGSGVRRVLNKSVVGVLL